MEPLTEAPILLGVGALPVALFLAAAVTKLVDLVRNVFTEHLENHKWASILFACVIGIGLAWLTNFNLFAELNIQERNTPLALCVTGLLLTGGAGGIHEFFDLMSSTATHVNPKQGAGAKKPA